MGSRADADPFAIFLTPPPNETAGERATREAREAEAKRISDEIDDQIRQDKAALSERRTVTKILLLGQSESGKSTILKRFRMKYSPNDWENERASWRAVIQLNLVRSILTIIEALEAEMDGDPLDAPMTPVTPFTPSSPLPSLAGPSNGSVPPLQITTLFHLNGQSGNASTQDSQSPLSTGSSIEHVSPNISSSFAPLHASHDTSSAPIGLAGRRPTTDTSNLAKLPLSSLLTDKHDELKRRLGPLRRVEADLRARLGTGADEDQDRAASKSGVLDSDALKSVGLSVDENGVVSATGSGGTSGAALTLPTTTTPTVTRRGLIKHEFSVRRLQDALENGKRTSMTSLCGQAVGPSMKKMSGSPDEPGGSEATGDDEDVDSVTSVIVGCKNDMLALWTDEAVQAILKRRKVRMEESSGFFLDDLQRIASHSYSPSDDDILRARLRTVGVQEHKIHLENSSLFNLIPFVDFRREWLLYDVGASRTMHQAWIPFFQEITCIFFMAPVSCFDECLPEDSRINRLEDSFLLWRTICSSKLLVKVPIILFLNKCDLLKRKLESGVKVRDHLPSFGNRSNDVNTVVKYFQKKLKDIEEQHSPVLRSSHFYATSLVDTRAPFTTINAAKDSILRDFLKSVNLI